MDATARPLRIDFPGAIHHVTARGNRRALVFRDDLDAERFLSGLERVVRRHGWICHAYCLMPNHYHLLVEMTGPALSRGVARLNGRYAQQFNARHGQVGHVFQGRFHGVLVDRESYLLELARYVVLNPIRAGLCRWPDEWRWSSFGGTAGVVDCREFLTTGWLLGQFGAEIAMARRRYTSFVLDAPSRSPWDDLRGGTYLGPAEFAARFAPGRPVRDVPRRVWQPVRPPLSEMVPNGTPAEIRCAVEHGYSLRELADGLGVHATTVGRHLAKAEDDGDARCWT